MNIFTTTKRFATLAAVLCLGGASASAIENLTIDDMQLGVEYNIGDQYMFGDFEGTYTPTQDMRLRVEFNLNMLCCEVWGNPEHNVPYPGAEYISGSDYIEFDVTVGKPVYFFTNFIMNPFTMILKDASETEVTLRDVSVKEMSKISISRDHFIDFQFSSPVTADGATLSSGEKSAEIAIMNLDAGTVLRVDISETIMGWYRQNALKAGDEMTLTLNNVKAGGEPVGDGSVVMHYIAMDMPVTLVRTENMPTSGEQTFLSYYLPTNPAAYAKMFFSGPLMPLDNKSQTLSATLQMGDLSYADRSYTERLHPTLEGDGTELVFDFAGVRRSYEDMGVPATDENAGYIDLLVSGIKGADGQFVYSPSDSSIGSFGYRYTFKEVSSNVTVDFTPARGAKVKAGQDMEIYIMGLQNIDYNGIKFAYGDKEYVLAKDQLTVVVDPEDEEANLIQFKMPELEGITEGEEIVMTFADLITADGYDHSAQLTCNYVADATEGIEALTGEMGAEKIYSIDGSRVKGGNLAKGIYIINGKKVIIK